MPPALHLPLCASRLFILCRSFTALAPSLIHNAPSARFGRRGETSPGLSTHSTRLRKPVFAENHSSSAHRVRQSNESFHRYM